MKKRMMVAAAAGMVLVGVVCGAAQAYAQDKGYWYGVTSQTLNMTVQITIDKAKVTINESTFPLVPVRRLKPAEVSAMFDADVNAGISGDLYRLYVPAGKNIAAGYTLCGGEDTRWMATYVTGHTLRVAFFSGDDEPVFTFDAISNSTTLCARYMYTK